MVRLLKAFVASFESLTSRLDAAMANEEALALVLKCLMEETPLSLLFPRKILGVDDSFKIGVTEVLEKEEEENAWRSSLAVWCEVSVVGASKDNTSPFLIFFKLPTAAIPNDRSKNEKKTEQEQMTMLLHLHGAFFSLLSSANDQELRIKNQESRIKN